MREPDTTGPVQILRQPLVYPLHVRTSGPSCAAASSTTRQTVWPVVVGVLLLLAAGAVVTRRRFVDPARGTDGG